MAVATIERIVLVCGDRAWTARGPIEFLLRSLPKDGKTVVITGGANGADRIAWEIAREIGHRNVRLDAPWGAYGKRAGPIRNQWMLDLFQMFANAFTAAAADVHAYHQNIASSKGTADMLIRVRHAGVEYKIHSDVEEGIPVE